MTSIQRVCDLVFPNNEPTEQQINLITNIVDLVEERLLSYLPKKYEFIPTELSYIVIEVSIKRFNKIGSEGMQSESVEGHSATYFTNDFEEYMSDIDRFIKNDDEDYTSDMVVKFY